MSKKPLKLQDYELGTFELEDAKTGISYGVNANIHSARERARTLAEVTGRAIRLKCIEIYYPQLPF